MRNVKMLRLLAWTCGVIAAALLLNGCNSPLPAVKQISAGNAHACALDSDIDGVRCWGDNSQGQTSVPTLTKPRFVTTGGDVSCAIANNVVRCWGSNADRLLDIPALTSPTAVAIGDHHACAITSTGVSCWGDNSKAQFNVPTLTGIKSISAGANHTCVTTTDGVSCWGDNSFGQTAVPALSGVKQLAAGGDHNCVIDSSGVKCWGGEISNLLESIPITTQPKVIASGRYHSCVTDADGVQCWGDDTIANNLLPRDFTNVTQLVVGGGDNHAHACVQHQQGIVCWGDNNKSQTDYNGLPYHIVYRAEADINAPPEFVWSVLMDLDGYPQWNPFTIAMNSPLEVGAAMNMKVKMSDLLILDQTEYIRVLTPHYKACWGINTTTPELNSGERCQWLEQLENGGTRYITEDLIEGTQTPTVTSLFDSSLQSGFDGVASGLKEYVEANYSR